MGQEMFLKTLTTTRVLKIKSEITFSRGMQTLRNHFKKATEFDAMTFKKTCCRTTSAINSKNFAPVHFINT